MAPKKKGVQPKKKGVQPAEPSATAKGTGRGGRGRGRGRAAQQAVPNKRGTSKAAEFGTICSWKCYMVRSWFVLFIWFPYGPCSRNPTSMPCTRVGHTNTIFSILKPLRYMIALLLVSQYWTVIIAYCTVVCVAITFVIFVLIAVMKLYSYG